MKKKRDNLISLRDRSREERQKIARKGAMVSNRKQRNKKNLKQLLQLILSLPVDDSEKAEKLRAAGIADTRGAALLVEAVETAGKNPAMFKNIMELTGFGFGLEGAIANRDNMKVQIYLPDNQRNDNTTREE